jgi:hypothetical protein
MARLSSEHRPKAHVCAVKLPQLGVVEEDPVYVFVHLFQPDVFVSKNFAYENPTLVPADVSAVVHPPSQERLGILEARYATREHPSTGHINATWRFVTESLMRALMVERQSEAVELLLLRGQRARRRLRSVFLNVRCIRSCLPFC